MSTTPAAAIDRHVLSHTENQDYIVNYWKGVRVGETSYPEGSRLAGRYLMLAFGPDHVRRISNLVYTRTIYAIPAGTPGEVDTPEVTDEEFEAARARNFEQERPHGEADQAEAADVAALGQAEGVTLSDQGQADQAEELIYNPADHTMQEVMAWAGKHPEMIPALLEFETAEGGPNRKTLVKWLAG
jgi:hypothetical protein